MLHILYRKEYEHAAKELQTLLKRKGTQHDKLYYAAQIAQSYPHVNPKKLVKMVEHQELMEAAYVGNLGVMELVKFNKKASEEQKNKLKQHIKNKEHDKMRDLIKNVTGVKLHKSMHEEVKPDILPPSGAGQQGTDRLAKNYFNGTPGQSYKKFREYIK